MTVTAKDLRFNVLSKGEDVLITYRGKAKAKLVPYDTPNNEVNNDDMFGMWADKEESVDKMVRGMRTGRSFTPSFWATPCS